MVDEKSNTNIVNKANSIVLEVRSALKNVADEPKFNFNSQNSKERNVFLYEQHNKSDKKTVPIQTANKETSHRNRYRYE